MKLEFTSQASLALSDLGNLYFKGKLIFELPDNKSVAHTSKTWLHLPVLSIKKEELVIKDIFTGKNTLIVLSETGEAYQSGHRVVTGLPLEFASDGWEKIQLPNVVDVQIHPDSGLMVLGQLTEH